LGVISNIFRKFAEIFVSQGAPPVSTTPVVNFATSITGVVDTISKVAAGVSNTGINNTSN
jgi:hypothetical protein